MTRMNVTVGGTPLKNPLIAGSAEHHIAADGVRRALRTGAGAVVVKSINESERGRDRLQRAQYMLLDEQWREIPWTPEAPATAFIATRSGLTPQDFAAWLEQTVQLDREAKAMDSYAIASLIVADLANTVAMARQVEQAGVRILELNIGTPYASQARGVVSTELDPERVAMIVSTVRQAIGIPLWVKLTGQSERVPDLAAAAYRGGGDAVIMAGRLLGFVPDVETLQPLLGTALGVGGFWNLPLTCYWLAVSRQQNGPDKPLIATNGVRNGLDIVRAMLAGASAVEMASEVMLRGSSVLSDALQELDAYLQRKGLTAAELVGVAADQRKAFSDMPLRTDDWKKYVADGEASIRKD
ncbi:tRNA-dihydrouridine synthase [Rhodopseudomonas sp. RCAM05734]|uniref:tRNA-dihydrouridine synthase n=1 Tax=Rhodopseudomonas sp. RCAM05734 TaxID=3457549 RepID=UPI00404490C1